MHGIAELHAQTVRPPSLESRIGRPIAWINRHDCMMVKADDEELDQHPHLSLDRELDGNRRMAMAGSWMGNATWHREELDAFLRMASHHDATWLLPEPWMKSTTRPEKESWTSIAAWRAAKSLMNTVS